MASIIPNINAASTKMTSGERRFGQRLEAFLEDDYSCWFDIPVGSNRRYPDFIIAAQKYDLSINRYKEVVYQEQSYAPPKEILQELKKLEEDILKDLYELEAML